jgi:hypothetical protein
LQIPSILQHKQRSGGMAQDQAECLPSKHEALSSNLNTAKKKKKQSCFLIVGFQEFLKLCILDIRHLSVMYVTKIFSQWWFSFSFFV